MSVLFLLSAAFAASGAAAYASHSTIPARWKNCKVVHKRYPHGVGKNHAHDKTTGVPVTNFKHSTRLYTIAISHNKRLDADKDGIACEQH